MSQKNKSKKTGAVFFAVMTDIMDLNPHELEIGLDKALKSLLSLYLTMKHRIRKGFVSFLFLFLCLFLVSCVGKTDEDLILDLMGRIGDFAEKKDVSGVMTSLDENYEDFEGRDLTATEDMIRGYFDQFKGIVVNVLSTRIDEIKAPEATIQTDVALSSGAAKVFRKLIRLSTDNYRLRIKLRKANGIWKIRYAEWRYVGFDELFPESISIFNKIFKI